MVCALNASASLICHMRKEIIGDCELYLGNSLEILPTLNPVDLIVTDPPYLLTSGGGNPSPEHRKMSGCFNSDKYDNGGGLVICDIDWPDFMKPLFDALKPDSHCYVMCNNRHVKNMLSAAEDAGFGFHNLLVWDKMSCTPNRWYMKNIEFTGFFYKGKAKFINDCGYQQLMACPQENYGDHPTTKPTALMQHYIENSSQPGDIVLDPFMGAGSTGVAAVRSGRKFIGIEISEKYFDQACKRIEESSKKSDLFSPMNKIRQEAFI